MPEEGITWERKEEEALERGEERRGGREGEDL